MEINRSEKREFKIGKSDQTLNLARASSIFFGVSDGISSLANSTSYTYAASIKRTRRRRRRRENK